MCCFSKPVSSVSDTRIFARADEGQREFLVYSMSLEAKQDLAMILPLPVAAGTGEKGVEFINLEGYPDFFADLLKGFPVPPPRESRGHDAIPTAAGAAPRVDQRAGALMPAWSVAPVSGVMG